MIAATFNGAGLGAFLIFYLALIVVMFIAGWQIVSKAGYPGAMVLLMLIPLVNIVMFFVFAFSRWPVLQELDRYRGRLGLGYPAQAPAVPPPPPGWS